MVYKYFTIKKKCFFFIKIIIQIQGILCLIVKMTFFYWPKIKQKTYFVCLLILG